MKKQTGITLLELIIAVALVGILATLAVPGFGSFVRDNHLSGKYNNLAGNLSLARMEAVKRSRTLVLCASSNQTTCNETDWANGWLVFVDDNSDATFNTGETVLQVEKAAPSFLSITSAQFNGVLSIAPRGRLASSGTFILCNGTTDDKALALNIQVTGMARMATDGTDSDEIVEDISGNNVTCGTS